MNMPIARRLVLPLASLALVMACSSSDAEAPKAGESCSVGPDLGRCDGTSSLLECVNGTWTATPCRGAAGCVQSADKAECDESVGQVGDRCSSQDACSVDGTKLLHCADGALAVQFECSGPAKCKVQGLKAVCDQSVGELDQACGGTGYACSGDGSKILSCEGGKFALAQDCATSTKCAIASDGASCK